MLLGGAGRCRGGGRLLARRSLLFGAGRNEGGDAEAIKSKMEEMSQKIYAIFGKLYQQEGGQPGAGEGPQVNDDGTIDADAEVK